MISGRLHESAPGVVPFGSFRRDVTSRPCEVPAQDPAEYTRHVYGDVDEATVDPEIGSVDDVCLPDHLPVALHESVQGCMSRRQSRFDFDGYDLPSTHGVYRNRVREGMRGDGVLKAMYDGRPRVETSDSMVKGHTGSHILSGIGSSRIHQGLFRMIAHDTKTIVDRKPVARDTA